MFATYGDPNQAGKARRDEPSGRARGRQIAQRVRLVTVPVRDTEPIGTALMSSLAIAHNPRSPMNMGSAVSHATGAGITGRDPHRTPPLQNWLNLHGPVGKPNGVNVGMQGGPGAQPAFPSTGTTAAPSLTSTLAGMSLPQVLRNPSI